MITQTAYGEWKHPTQFSALCPDGRVRRTRWLAQEADTYFSWSAIMLIKGERVRGYVTGSEHEVGHTFIPYHAT